MPSRIGFELNDTSESYLKNLFGAKNLGFISETVSDAKRECEEKGLVWHDLTIDHHSQEGYKVINASAEQVLRSTNNSRSIRLQHKITGSIIESNAFFFDGFADELPKFQACTVPCHGRKPCLR